MSSLQRRAPRQLLATPKKCVTDRRIAKGKSSMQFSLQTHQRFSAWGAQTSTTQNEDLCSLWLKRSIRRIPVKLPRSWRGAPTSSLASKALSMRTLRRGTSGAADTTRTCPRRTGKNKLLEKLNLVRSKKCPASEFRLNQIQLSADGEHVEKQRAEVCEKPPDELQRGSRISA